MGGIIKEELLELEKEALVKENSDPYSWNQFMIYFLDCLINFKKEKPIEPNNQVLNYLMQVEDWGERELRLYALFGFILPVDTTHFLMRTAIKRSQLYQSIP